MCLSRVNGNTSKGFLLKNVSQPGQWKHIKRDFAQKCVSPQSMETHRKGFCSKMCLNQVDGNTSKEILFKNVSHPSRWKHIKRDFAQKCVSPQSMETHQKGFCLKMCLTPVDGNTSKEILPENVSHPVRMKHIKRNRSLI